MKRHLKLIVIILSIISALSNCTKDPATAPEENTGDPGTTKTIGPAGGEIEKDELSITIIPGTFSANHNITITDAANENSSGSNSVSKRYKISGLPAEYSNALHIKMKYNKPLSGSSFITVGEAVYDSLKGTTSIVSEPFDAIDSAGYLYAELPASNTDLSKQFNSYGSKVDDYDKFIESISGYAWAVSNYNYICYPTALATEVTEVGAKLDSANSIAWKLNLNYYAGAGREKVFIEYQDYIVNGHWKKKNSVWSVSRSHVEQHKYNDIRIDMGRRLIDREFYSFNYSFVNVNKNWFNGAVLAYAEEMFTEDQNFKYPAEVDTFGMEPFKGMISKPGTDNKTQYRYGGGLASLIKYLVGDPRYGKPGISKTYENFGVYGNSTEALIQSVDGKLIDWHPDFFKKLVNREIYELPENYFLDKASAEWNINSAGDTLKIFSSGDPSVGTYRDLSAKIFKINLNNPEVTETGKMFLKMKGNGNQQGLSLIVFGIKNGKTEYIGSSYANDVELQNLKGYSDNGMNKFLLVLVNSNGSKPFTNESSIDLEVKVDPGEESGDPSILTYTKCSASLKVIADVIESTADSTDIVTRDLILGGARYITGSFKGNTFTGGADYNGIKDTITITLDPELTAITSVEWHVIENNEQWQILYEYGYTAAGIPVSSSEKNVFNLAGSGVCNTLSKVIYHYSDFNGTKDIEEYQCDNLSNIYIGFIKE